MTTVSTLTETVDGEPFLPETEDPYSPLFAPKRFKNRLNQRCRMSKPRVKGIIKYTTLSGQVFTKKQPVEIDNNEYLVDIIRDVRKTKSGRYEYLLKWNKCKDVHNTWEPEIHLTNCKELKTEFWNRRKLLPLPVYEKPKRLKVPVVTPKADFHAARLQYYGQQPDPKAPARPAIATLEPPTDNPSGAQPAQKPTALQKTKRLGGLMACPAKNCTFSFENLSAVAVHRHKVTHQKPQKCPDCKKVFQRTDSLNRHIAKQHN